MRKAPDSTFVYRIKIAKLTEKMFKFIQIINIGSLIINPTRNNNQVIGFLKIRIFLKENNDYCFIQAQ